MTDIDRIAQEAAASIGTAPEQVLEVIMAANELQFLTRGISTEAMFQRTLDQGILPRSPEGNGSWWATGSRIFGSVGAFTEGRVSTYDTSFFHYAMRNAHPIEPVAYATLALTRVEDLKTAAVDVRFKTNGSLVVTTPIPSSAFQVLHVQTSKGETASERAFVARQMLFGCLYEAVCKGRYTPGEKNIRIIATSR